jgi:hypothetical protein
MQMPDANTGSSANGDKAVSAGAERNQAAHIAKVAAGIVVGTRGTACVTPEDNLGKIHGENESRASFQSLSTTPSSRAIGVRGVVTSSSTSHAVGAQLLRNTLFSSSSCCAIVLVDLAAIPLFIRYLGECCAPCPSDRGTDTANRQAIEKGFFWALG